MTEITEEMVAVARDAWKSCKGNNEEAMRAALTAAFASRPSQGGEWDDMALAACRVAWPNFDTFGTESKSKRLQEMRVAFSASPSYGVEGWQDIATAPKDGTLILGFARHGATGGRRREGVHRTAMRWHPSGVWVTVPSDYPIRPTHWRPLPVPPSLTKDQSNG